MPKSRASDFLYVVGQLGAGGLERQLYLLLRAMDKNYYRPAVVVWNFSEGDVYVSKIRALTIPVYSFSWTMSRIAKLFALRRLVKQLKPLVVHSYTFYTNLVAWLGTIGTNAIPIGAVRSDFEWAKNGNGHVLGNLSARWPRTQIFNSIASACQAQNSRSAFVPQNCFVVRNGLDLEQFPATPPPPNGRSRILGVGSLISVKRWDRALLAACQLKSRGADFLLQIAGEGPLRQQLEQQAQNLGIGDRVEFLGYTEDIANLLAEASFLMHTSESEGCPNVVMEAMACGRPVIATDVGDISRLIDDGKTGFVVRAGDEATLVTRIVTLLSNSELRRRMGEASQAKAKQEFGLDRLVTETLAIYEAAGWKKW